MSIIPVYIVIYYCIFLPGFAFSGAFPPLLSSQLWEVHRHTAAWRSKSVVYHSCRFSFNVACFFERLVIFYCALNLWESWGTSSRDIFLQRDWYSCSCQEWGVPLTWDDVSPPKRVVASSRGLRWSFSAREELTSDSRTAVLVSASASCSQLTVLDSVGWVFFFFSKKLPYKGIPTYLQQYPFEVLFGNCQNITFMKQSQQAR